MRLVMDVSANQILASSADIDDISQEVFLRLLRYDRSELVERPQAYLYKVASNVSAEWHMRASRRLPHNSAWLGELVDSISPEDTMRDVDTHRQLRLAVSGLPARAQEILRRHFAEGQTYVEVAATMGVTRRIVYRDVERAYAALRQSFAVADDAGGRQRAGKDHDES